MILTMLLRLSIVILLGMPVAAAAQAFQPEPWRPGKDVVWVPTPAETVDKMLDMAGVTPKDFVVDLGSGDGRLVIAAAKRGARALGIEYDPEMVALARRNAEAAGVGDKARFIQGDMYEADFSQATVLALFLLPQNLRRLAPKFLALAAGTRIVTNTYRIEDWEDEESATASGGCYAWCSVYRYVVPAQVAGTWHLPGGDITFTQSFQALSGTLRASGRDLKALGEVKGDRIHFSVGLDTYTGRVHGDSMNGQVAGATSGYWTATRVRGQGTN